MIKRKYYVLILGILFTPSLFAQVRLKAMVIVDYSYGFPSGDLNDYVPEKTFDGVHFQYRHFKKRNCSIGLRTGWNSFSTKLPRAVYETDRGTVSAVQTRYFHSFPFLLTAHYYLRSLHYVMPYAGGGLGGYHLRYEKYFGVVEQSDSNIKFGVSPEAGVIIPFKNSGLGLILSGRYTKVFYENNEINNLNYFEASLGIYFGYVFLDYTSNENP